MDYIVDGFIFLSLLSFAVGAVYGEFPRISITPREPPPQTTSNVIPFKRKTSVV